MKKHFQVKKISGLFLMIILAAACGGNKDVKHQSQESRIAQEAFSAAESIRASYINKDFSGLAEKCTKEGYREIVDSVRHFDSADLEFTPRWVEIEDSKVYLNVSWKGVWRIGDNTARERGMAVFLFEGRPLRLGKILRGSPFRYPER